MALSAEGMPQSAFDNQDIHFNRVQLRVDYTTATPMMDCDLKSNYCHETESGLSILEMKTDNPILATSPFFSLTTKRAKKTCVFVLFDAKMRKYFIPHAIADKVSKALWSTQKQQFMLLTDDSIWALDPKSGILIKECSINIGKKTYLSSFAIIKDQLVIATDGWGPNTLSHWEYDSQSKNWTLNSETPLELSENECICDVSNIGDSEIIAMLIYNETEDQSYVKFQSDQNCRSLYMPKDKIGGDLKILGTNEATSNIECLIYSSSSDHVIGITKSLSIVTWSTDLVINQMVAYNDDSLLIRSKKNITHLLITN